MSGRTDNWSLPISAACKYGAGSGIPSLYFPTNPTDDLVAAMQERGLKIGFAKVGLDVACMVLTVLFKGEIGIGTIFCTLGLGPLIDIFYGWLKKQAEKYHVVVS